MARSPTKKEGFQALEGGSSLFDVGNLEKEEYSVRRCLFLHFKAKGLLS